MTSDRKSTQPNLVGFHTHGLITAVGLDCLWMVLEIGSGFLVTIFVGVIFGTTSYIVFTKQRLLGDSQSTALSKAVFLGIIAGLPFSFTSIFIFGVFGFLNKVMPATENLAIKLPDDDTYHLGSFIEEFKQLEHTLSNSVAAIDPSKRSDKLAENAKFMQEQGKIPWDVFDLLERTRDIRNNVIHGHSNTFSDHDLQVLRQCKAAVENALKR